MRYRILYLLSFLMFLAACSDADEEKTLYPTKVIVGGTTHDFHYDKGRIYSVTTIKPEFYEFIEYRYYDKYFNEPEHRFKDKIFELRYAPDNGIIGWDSSDSVKHKQVMLSRSDAGIIERESEGVYLGDRNVYDDIRHKYNAEGQPIESTHYIYETSFWSESQLNDERFISKRVKYAYAQGKLAKAAYYAPGAEKPYLLIELAYDHRPGYLRSLPLEARFMPLELPYRDHNIISYTVKDFYGKVRKDLSYTCTYSYNRDGYPAKFTRSMLDGQEIKGQIVYKAAVGKSEEVALME